MTLGSGNDGLTLKSLTRIHRRPRHHRGPDRVVLPAADGREHARGVPRRARRRPATASLTEPRVARAAAARRPRSGPTPRRCWPREPDRRARRDGSPTSAAPGRARPARGRRSGRRGAAQIAGRRRPAPAPTRSRPGARARRSARRAPASGGRASPWAPAPGGRDASRAGTPGGGVGLRRTDSGSGSGSGAGSGSDSGSGSGTGDGPARTPARDSGTGAGTGTDRARAATRPGLRHDRPGRTDPVDVGDAVEDTDRHRRPTGRQPSAPAPAGPIGDAGGCGRRPARRCHLRGRRPDRRARLGRLAAPRPGALRPRPG